MNDTLKKSADLVDPEDKDTASQKISLQHKHTHNGIVQRFLNWIARGAKKSETSSMSCPA